MELIISESFGHPPREAIGALGGRYVRSSVPNALGTASASPRPAHSADAIAWEK
jgi:hypothetical protein